MKANVKILVLAAASLAALSSCRSDEVKALLRKEHKTEPVSVTAIRVGRSESVSSTRLVGRVEPGKSAVISSQWPGTLEKVNVRKGQKVDRGSILAIIDAQGVKSSYDAAMASLNQAEDALQRVQKIYGNGSVSEIKLLDIKTQYAKAAAAAESAREALEDCSVKAPFGGVIGEIFVEQGVKLGAMTPLFEILDNSRIEVHASIPENEYSRYPVGTGAEIEIPATGDIVSATLAVKGIQASSLSHSYDLCFKTDVPAPGIMPGMTCKVRIKSALGKKNIVIPASAVKTDAQGRYVWCCENSVVQKRHITTGEYCADGVIVQTGLEEGDLVITRGARKVSSGMKDIKVNVL